MFSLGFIPAGFPISALSILLVPAALGALWVSLKKVGAPHEKRMSRRAGSGPSPIAN